MVAFKQRGRVWQAASRFQRIHPTRVLCQERGQIVALSVEMPHVLLAKKGENEDGGDAQLDKHRRK